MAIARKINLIFIVICALIQVLLVQEIHSQELYKASVFTSKNGFTSGIEGPVVDKNGDVYVVNFERNGTIGKVSPKGKSGLFIELPEGSVGNGIRFDSEGNMFIADYTNHNILKVDMPSKQLTILAHEPKMSQPNDIAIDKKNRLYASDPDWEAGTGRIWRIDPNGSVLLLKDNLGTANGIEVSPDEKTLYVNETVQRKVWSFNLSPEGEISDKRLLIEFPDFGMDGMRCDTQGNLYITRHGKGTVVQLSPDGKIITEIELTGKKPSNIAFGGKDGCTAYVTLQDQGNVETFRVPFPGRAWKMLNDSDE